MGQRVQMVNGTVRLPGGQLLTPAGLRERLNDPAWTRAVASTQGGQQLLAEMRACLEDAGREPGNKAQVLMRQAGGDPHDICTPAGAARSARSWAAKQNKSKA